MTGATAPGRTLVAGAIDIGSNSAHLLVARVLGAHELDPLADESVFLGLGEAVASTGHLGRGARARVVEAIAGYVARAVELGADPDRILLLGTEPVRRAADGAALVAEVGTATGVPLLALSHEEEGWLNLLGVTAGRRVEGTLAVIDSGGGSTEVVVVRQDGRHDAFGLRLGSAALTASIVRADPPSPPEVDALRREAVRLVGALPPSAASAVVGVGGTASNLAKVIPEAREDRRLTRARLETALAMFLATPAEALRERFLLNPRRAPLMVAGAVILETLLDRLGADELTVSEAGLREGALLAAAHAGSAWRDRLPALAAGWTTDPRT